MPTYPTTAASIGGLVPASSDLLINLAYLNQEATGLSHYGLQLVPHLIRILHPVLLSPCRWPGATTLQIPNNMTAIQGLQGHLRRLIWTQTQLGQIYHQIGSRLLFSPVPEAPLGQSIRKVITVHDLIPLRFPSRSFSTLYFRSHLPRLLKESTHIFCNSQATAQDLQSFYQVPEQRLTITPLACDRQQFRPLRLDRRNYFVYVGRLNPYKNLQRLIKAFALIQRQLDCELWLVGPVDRRFLPAVQAQIEAQGLTEVVRFKNYVPREELPIILNQAIALVHPSLWEGFGLTVLEAMSCGTPVLVADRSSLPEVVGDAGLYFDPLQPEAIAESMQAIAQDSGLQQRLSAAALARSQQFSWERTSRITIQQLQALL
ncbi:glycosyltransferase family 4 protein [Synechococcus elongatus]|uniref:glycosyltransferase family 4 protein n=1 Tax=Synechococcus elongatus TaxID=32046 RepID=UPI000F7F8750|nr:glycosyltransferase family 1 protein [Synechococcus elongatus]